MRGHFQANHPSGTHQTHQPTLAGVTLSALYIVITGNEWRVGVGGLLFGTGPEVFAASVLQRALARCLAHYPRELGDPDSE